MIKTKTILAALALCGLFATPAAASETGGVPTKFINWSFGGVFGTYDKNQLQRGFQIFKEVCSSCHSANLLAFRNLSEPGGPGYSEAQVKALAATFTVADPEAEDGERPGIAADRWPATMSPADAKASFGVEPPDFSVLAKARSATKPGFSWVLDYFTVYQEGGPDFIYNLLTNFTDAPHGVEVAAGQYYNAYTGGVLAMAPPLSDGLVTYDDNTVPETVEQYSKDVAAFMMWVAEPHLDARKELGFKVIIILAGFAVLMYLTKRKLWSKIEH